VTTCCESPLITLPRLTPVVRDMEKVNLPERNLTTNMIVIEETKAFTMNDALTRTLVYYHKFAPYNVR
jgi:hypothetical protein